LTAEQLILGAPDKGSGNHRYYVELLNLIVIDVKRLNFVYWIVTQIVWIASTRSTIYGHANQRKGRLSKSFHFCSSQSKNNRDCPVLSYHHVNFASRANYFNPANKTRWVFVLNTIYQMMGLFMFVSVHTKKNV
jgi:hypothetical protein